MGKMILNEQQLKNIVLKAVKRTLNEMAEVGGNAGGDQRGKAYYEKIGLIPVPELGDEGAKVYMTATCLANRKLNFELGARWGTASSKRVFNAYTVDSDCILLVAVGNYGESMQLQCGRDGVKIATTPDDRQVEPEDYAFIDEKLPSVFDKLFNMAKTICAEEDQFFASKTSKTYDRLKESKNRNRKKLRA